MRLDAPRARLVAVSSAAVYGSGHTGAITEDAQTEPFSPYGYHKLMMESLCRSYGASFGLNSVVARLFSVFGPGLRKQLLWDTCVRLETGEQPLVLGGTGDELRDWTDVRDVVRAIAGLPAEASPKARPLNVGTGIATPVRQVATWLAEAFHGSGPMVDVRFSGQSRPGDPFSLVADGSRLAALGFEWQRPVRQAFRDYVQWFRSRDGRPTPASFGGVRP
jgi:UDP-glucose 4-epimerase